MDGRSLICVHTAVPARCESDLHVRVVCSKLSHANPNAPISCFWLLEAAVGLQSIQASQCLIGAHDIHESRVWLRLNPITHQFVVAIVRNTRLAVEEVGSHCGEAYTYGSRRLRLR